MAYSPSSSVGNGALWAFYGFAPCIREISPPDADYHSQLKPPGLDHDGAATQRQNMFISVSFRVEYGETISSIVGTQHGHDRGKGTGFIVSASSFSITGPPI